MRVDFIKFIAGFIIVGWLMFHFPLNLLPQFWILATSRTIDVEVFEIENSNKLILRLP